MKKASLKKAINPPGEMVDMEVVFISIVPAGANGQVGIAKALEGGPLTIATAELRKGDQTVRLPVLADLQKAVIRKEDIAKQVFFCPVYLPDTPDTHGAWASAEVIEKAAHGFMAKGYQGNVDLSHSFVAEDAVVVESWITKGQDPLFPEVPGGTWCVCIKVNDSEIWGRIEKGELKSVSMGGLCAVSAEEIAKEEGMSQAKPGLLARVKKALGMDPDKINKETDGPVSFQDYEKHWDSLLTLDDLIWRFLCWAWQVFDGPGTKEEKLATFKAGLDFLGSQAAPLFMDAVEKEEDDEPDARAAAMAKAKGIVLDVITKALAVSKAVDDEALQKAVADLEKLADADTEAAVMEIAKSVGLLAEQIEKLAEGSEGEGSQPEPASAEQQSEMSKSLDLLAARVEKMAEQLATIGWTVAPSKVKKETEPAEPDKDEGWNILPK